MTRTTSVWLPNKAYKVGEEVHAPADVNHVYVCTVAGTSGKDQPKFPDGAGATVTDGGVTWAEDTDRKLALKTRQDTEKAKAKKADETKTG